MNKLFIIGNGFDLAHNLKTRYSDFLLWYINKTIRNFNASHSNTLEDDLIILDGGGYKVNEFESLNSFREGLARGHLNFNCKNSFFTRIIRSSTDSKWVDIEYEYFCQLLGLYKAIEKHNMGINDGAETQVKKVNDCFDLIKKELIAYLKTIKSEEYNNTIENRFMDELKIRKYSEILFLVFNYTKTIEPYLKSLKVENGYINYIHGQLDDVENPIIFGYGDEMNEYYSKIESLNINEFLKNLKTFSYLKTNNYQNLDHFINKEMYTVSIMGHSCGLSDRVLLNSIFCHKNCQKIRIYFYKRSEIENDYFEKTQEISRHFEDKGKMRTMIVPLPGSCSLS